MDPAAPRRPKYWRGIGKVAVLLLLAASVTAAGAWLASMWGRDPGTAYRLAIRFGAGGLMLGLIWAGSAGMGGGDEMSP